jgi:tripartite-type tricarboxylate transporter receptor subunit TctC
MAKAGRVRALAVSTSKRSAAAPDIPTLNELGIRGFDASAWFGFFVPAGTPAEVIKRLNEETMATLKDPTVREQLLALGSDPIGSSPAEFGRFYRAEVEKWGKVVHAAGVKLE